MNRYSIIALTFLTIGCSSDTTITSSYTGPPISERVVVDPPVFSAAPMFPIDSTWNEDNRGYLVGEEQTERGTAWVNWAGPWNIWNFRYITDPDIHPIRRGWRSERIEVRPGDCFKNDCFRSPRFERVERTENPFQNDSNPNVNGDTVWYGWSFYFPGDVPELYWAYITQFHEHSPHNNPSWAFLKRAGQPLCLLHDMSKARQWICDPWTELPQKTPATTYPIIPHDQFYDRWHDMVMHAHWSTNSDGFLRLWVNGTLVLDYKGITFDSQAEYMIFKYGIYRTAYNQNNIGYFDEIRRGKTREEVDILMMN
jgi:hypothetical protein